MTETLDSYTAAVARVRQRYGRQIVEYLDKLAAYCEAAGIVCAIPTVATDRDSRDVEWTLLVRGSETMGGRDLTVKLALLESENHAGFLDGVAWSLSILDSDGETLAHFSPGNYTAKIWVSVSDEMEIGGRFETTLGCLDGRELVYAVRTGKLHGQS